MYTDTLDQRLLIVYKQLPALSRSLSLALSFSCSLSLTRFLSFARTCSLSLFLSVTRIDIRDDPTLQRLCRHPRVPHTAVALLPLPSDQLPPLPLHSWHLYISMYVHIDQYVCTYTHTHTHEYRYGHPHVSRMCGCITHVWVCHACITHVWVHHACVWASTCITHVSCMCVALPSLPS